MPKQLSDLRIRSKAISDHLNGSDLESLELQKELAKVSELAKSMNLKVAPQSAMLSKQLASISSLVEKYKNDKSKGNVNEIWVQIQVADEALSQWLQDREWDKANGN